MPVCAVPFGRDQLEVARRVEVAQAGSRLPASRLRPDRLRRAVREAMERADGAKRAAAAFAAAGGATAAADALEANLDREVIARVRARVEATRTRVSDEAILEARDATGDESSLFDTGISAARPWFCITSALEGA